MTATVTVAAGVTPAEPPGQWHAHPGTTRSSRRPWPGAISAFRHEHRPGGEPLRLLTSE